jgi:hypothetical protein
MYVYKYAYVCIWMDKNEFATFIQVYIWIYIYINIIYICIYQYICIFKCIKNYEDIDDSIEIIFWNFEVVIEPYKSIGCGCPSLFILFWWT